LKQDRIAGGSHGNFHVGTATQDVGRPPRILPSLLSIVSIWPQEELRTSATRSPIAFETMIEGHIWTVSETGIKACRTTERKTASSLSGVSICMSGFRWTCALGENTPGVQEKGEQNCCPSRNSHCILGHDWWVVVPIILPGVVRAQGGSHDEGGGDSRRDCVVSWPISVIAAQMPIRVAMLQGWNGACSLPAEVRADLISQRDLPAKAQHVAWIGVLPNQRVGILNLSGCARSGLGRLGPGWFRAERPQSIALGPLGPREAALARQRLHPFFLVVHARQ
jgi:hypothetical protein